jgi:PAS domain S-box-containing protein
MDWVPVLFHGAVEAITGYTEADFTAGRPRWDQVIHPEDWPGIRDSAERIRLVPGTSVEREYRIVRKDGEIRWVLELARNDCDDSGKPAWVQGCVYDITARKRSEERLAESEELYRTLVKTFPDAVTITDLTGIITFASERTLSLHGFTGPEEVLGKSAFDLFAPEDREKALEALQITLKKGLVTTYEYTLLRKDGTRFLVELNASLIHDASGQPKAFVATTRDITERRRMEEERRKMETAKIASETIEAMADGLILFSLDGTILAVNPARRFPAGLERSSWARNSPTSCRKT